MPKKKKAKQRQIKKVEISPEKVTGPVKTHLILLFVLVVMTFGVYSNSLLNDFVYDDTFTITENSFSRDWKNLPDLFSLNYFSHSGEETYRPVVTLSYFIDHTLWGLNPFGYHLTNLFIHSINVVLVYLFAIVLFRDRRTGFLAALLFAIHPVQTEAVNAISFREDLLVVFFLLPAFLLFLEAHGQRSLFHRQSSIANHHAKWFFYFFSLLFYSLALFSKEMAVTFPLLLILYHLCFRNEGEKGDALNPQPAEKQRAEGRGQRAEEKTEDRGQRTEDRGRKKQKDRNPKPETRNPEPETRNPKLTYFLFSGYAAVTFIYLFLYFGPLSNPNPKTFSSPDLLTRLLNSPKVLLHYLWLIPVPWKLNADYVMNLSSSLLDPLVLSSIVILAGLAIAVYSLSRKYSKESFGLLWFFIALVPVMNIVPIYNPVAERYLYFPFIGTSLIISIVVIYLCGIRDGDRERKGVVPILVVLFLLVYAAKTVFRNMAWRDDFSLWSKTVVASPYSSRAHNNLGNAYYGQDRIEEAMEKYKEALRLRPGNTDAHYNLGRAYFNKDRIDEAIKAYKEALRLRPGHAKAHNNLGLAYFNKGRTDEAIEEYIEALRLEPNSAEAHNNLGLAYFNKGRTDEAIEEYIEALRLEPNSAEAHNNLGAAYGRKGLIDMAVEEFVTALHLDPDHAIAHFNLGVTYMEKRLKNEAIKELKETIKLKPDYEKARKILNRLITKP